MDTNLFLATNRGLVLAARDGADWRVTGKALTREHVTSVVAREGVILAGSHNGVWRSDDLGKSWEQASTGLGEPYVRWMAYHPDISDREFAGTEPADIFVSRDGAETWKEGVGVTGPRDQYHWFLPYSKGAGCIRGFAFHGERVYAAAEVGGALRSDDGGKTWQLCEGSNGNPDLEGPPEPLIYPDVHSIETHPSSPDLVFAPTGGGFYLSRDGGKTWKLVYDCYVRACWIDPRDARHWILAPADHVDANGRIEETRDGGASWHLASDGLTVPWRNHMVERFKQIGDELYGVLSNGELIVAPLDTLQWRRIFEDIKDINAVSGMA